MDALEKIKEWPAAHSGAGVLSQQEQYTAGDVDRVFSLASVTKPLVAYAVLVAIEEGAVDLDTPAGPAESTVRHLLAHTAGVAFDSSAILARPGTRRIYSSAGFEILARIVEDHTQIAFPEYLRQAVFEPLQMTSSNLLGSAGHGATSTVNDLLKFAGELLSPTLLSPDSFAQATTVQFPGLDGVLPGFGIQRPNDWGLGFEIRGTKNPHWTSPENSPQTYGHFGQSGTFLWVDPAISTACMALSDENFGEWARREWPSFSTSVIAAAKDGK